VVPPYHIKVQYLLDHLEFYIWNRVVIKCARVKEVYIALARLDGKGMGRQSKILRLLQRFRMEERKTALSYRSNFRVVSGL